MRSITFVVAVALGAVAVAAARQQPGSSVTIGQAPGSVPSTIPRVPSTPVNLPPVTTRGPVPSVTHPDLPAEQQRVIQQLQQLPEAERRSIEERLRQQGIDLADIEKSVREGKLIPRRDDQSIFRVIKDELKPIPIGPGGLAPAFPASVHPWGRALDVSETARMLTAAQSVGRIESGDASPVLRGTAFVAGPGLIATNCHVLRLIAEPSGNAWALTRTSVQIDFAEGSAHNQEREFRIEGIAAFPTAPYLDVALLRVATTSLGGNKPLPPPLPLRRTPLAAGSPAQSTLVGVIGYPNLANFTSTDRLTEQTFLRIRESGDRAKTLSLGAVLGIDSHEGIDFIDHVASTHTGHSGSPVVDRATGDVIGVHYCCAVRGALPLVSPLACSSQLLSDRENNEAVSSWTVARDRLTGPLLPTSRSAFLAPLLRREFPSLSNLPDK